RLRPEALREGGADGCHRAAPCCPPFPRDLLRRASEPAGHPRPRRRSRGRSFLTSPAMTSSFGWDTFLTTSYANLDGTCEVAEPETDQRWSTWPETAHTLDRGPQPFPDWVVQHDGAIDAELGVLKTGKEADAFLIE